MKKNVKIVAGIVVVAMIVMLAVRAVKHKKAEEAMIPPAKEYAVVVSSVTPKMEEVTLTLPFIAVVQNENDTVVASKLSARVVMIDKAGAHVKKGEVVAKLDTTDLFAKLQGIKAQMIAAKEEMAARKTSLANLETVHERTRKLLEVQGASQEEFDAEVSKIAAAKAAIAGVKAKMELLVSSAKEVANLIDYAVIEAPVSGTVGKAFVNPGDLAMPGKPLLEISAKAGDYLMVRLPDNLPAEQMIYNGKTYRLYPLNHTYNGLKEYRSLPLNSGLQTGEKRDVDIVVYKGRGVMLPVDALLNKNGKHLVLTVEHGHAVAHDTKIVAEGEQGIVVAEEGIVGKPVVVAKPDLLLKLLTGIAVVVKK
ncbi:RND family efflux transporter [Hydrogenimonas cancrithermarum]|uniref:Cation efflux system (CzcB-like) n=1 Tax=Hydrogenimonas cancrithermarum TaxID=2993563 RepID=A0ABM8FJA5_9BACT|nr:efflux transporter periplasmic adaptor subunit [Hydrogenimonas cancrithermarum]BDY12372.1 cation efflux system (czcB-like) [Hydrogenimonas cancrithermarum]